VKDNQPPRIRLFNVVTALESLPVDFLRAKGKDFLMGVVLPDRRWLMAAASQWLICGRGSSVIYGSSEYQYQEGSRLKGCSQMVLPAVNPAAGTDRRLAGFFHHDRRSPLLSLDRRLETPQD